ncbi:MAG: hypothetical protein ACJ8F7_12440 [Gemmataceae bacterium]
MSWFSRITRFGSGHMVRSQDQAMACAMSSIAMVNFKMKKGLMFAGVAAGASISASPIPGASYVGATLSSAAIDYAVKSEQEIGKMYSAIEGKAHDFGTDGADPTLYAQILPKLGLGNWQYVDVGEAGFAQAVVDAVADGTPVIGRVRWDAGGGHAVCIDQTHSFMGTTYLCVCDPWDGELRLISCTPGSTVKYDGSYNPISTGTFFGGTAHEYDATNNNKGKFFGGLVRQA